MARDEDPRPIEIVGTSGCTVHAADGTRYLDFTSGWCVGNLGWGSEVIKKRLCDFAGPDYVAPNYLYRPWAELAQMLAEITPGKLTKSFRATGGTEAVELALRSAMAATGRQKFLSIEGAYHGDSIGTMSIGASGADCGMRDPLVPGHKINPPLDGAAADEAEKWLRQKDIAAFIMEPVIMNLGVLIPTSEFMKRIQELCRENGTLLIMDEVASGFGRTGKLFATEYYNLEPDIMCLAKAITGGYVPMGATVVTEQVASAMRYDSSYYSTYGWHPLSVEAALTIVGYMRDNRSQIMEQTAHASGKFKERLGSMNFKSAAEIRIKGLAIALAFSDSEYGSQLRSRARKHGLLVSGFDKGITLFPPLTISEQDINEGMDILERCL